MRILIDGDGCPQREEIAEVCQSYELQVIVFIDYAHVLNNQHYEVRYCEIGHDSVDLMILKEIMQDDLVITQDYGLASLALSKGAKVLHVSGKILNQDNIQFFLQQRYMGYQMRKQDKHIKGPKKRTREDDMFFINQFKKILEQEK